MKKLTLFLAIFISISTVGQNSSTEFNKILIGFNFSPDISYRSLKNNDGSSTSSAIIKTRNKNEQPSFNFTSGITFCYNFSKHWGLETGLQYSRKGEKYVLNTDGLKFGGDPIDSAWGFPTPTDGNVLTKARTTYNYHYFEIPMRAIYTFGEKRVRYIAGFGVTTNIFLLANQTSVMKFENADNQRNTIKLSNDYKPINLSPTLSFGVDYQLTDKMNIRIEPTFRYGILKIIDTPVTSYLWSGGLNIGWYYRLK